MYLRLNLFLLILLVSCSKDIESNYSFLVIDENGVTKAVTSGVPQFVGEIFEYQEIVRLHQDESNEESILFQARQYLMGEDGNYYVNDRGNVRIAVFNSDGKYLRSFGRDGDGPGEFRVPRILWIRNDNIAVYDSRNRRTSLFNLDGIFIQSFSLSKAGNISELHPIQDGCMVVIDNGLVNFGVGDNQARFYRAIVVTQGGDTLGQVESPPYFLGEMVSLEEYGMGLFNAPYFNPTSSVKFYLNKGIMTFSTSEPEVKWYNLDGDLFSVIRVEMAPPPVTSEDRQAIERMLDSSIQAASNDQQLAMAKLRKKHAIIPEEKAYWRTIFVDDYGYYWLSCNPDYSAEGMERYMQPYKVLSPKGEYLGESTSPEAVTYFSQGHALTFYEDEETGEAFYVVYRIIPAVEGLNYP